jgi:antitoxin YobK
VTAVDDVNIALEEAAQRGVGRPSGSNGEAGTREAEDRLGLRFPPSYRAFLNSAGSGTFGWYEIYGLVTDLDAPGPPNVVWETRQAREKFQLPARFVLLVGLDDSSAYALDLEEVSALSEAPVVQIWPGEIGDDRVQGEVAPSFGQFLLNAVRADL